MAISMGNICEDDDPVTNMNHRRISIYEGFSPKYDMINDYHLLHIKPFLVVVWFGTRHDHESIGPSVASFFDPPSMLNDAPGTSSPSTV